MEEGGAASGGDIATATIPETTGDPLPVAYAVRALVVGSLIPPTGWFAGVKRRRGDGWLSSL